jgi:hypothetical protein
MDSNSITMAILALLVALGITVHALFEEPKRCPSCGRPYPVRESYFESEDCLLCSSRWLGPDSRYEL